MRNVKGWWKSAEAAVRASAAGVRTRAATGLAATMTLRHAAAELVFPSTCPSCDAELLNRDAASAGLPFCDSCFAELDLLTGPTCELCCGPLPKFSKESNGDPHGAAAKRGCFRCRGRKLWFDATVAAGLYEGHLRELLLRMKRAEGDWLSLAMGELLWRQCGERLASLEADVVAPIPLHWRRRLEHRTNSAAVLAEVISDRLRVPLAEGLLRRRVHTPRQSELTPPQRWKNVRRAFSVRSAYHLKEAHVLLVDDILTTGATCSEAGRTLRRAGAARITVVVAARAIG